MVKLPFLTEEESWALVLTTFAGLSTTVGAVFAEVIKKPDDALLAFLLGNAIGVMFSLSVAEMWLHNAMVHGWPEITVAFGLGAMLYHVAHPFIPDFGSHHPDPGQPQSMIDKLFMGEDTAPVSIMTSPESRAERSDSAGSQPERRSAARGASSSIPMADTTPDKEWAANSGGSYSGECMNGSHSGRMPRMRPRQLLRLGLLMAVTMTLHNLPEGFAVAFAAFTDFGPIMAIAIAIHNFPEGVIVAAPMYAATGSRWKALGLATASGLSEPVGALLALLLVKPFLTEALLHYILGFVGGLMAAVSILELWPEARRCHHDRRMGWGIAVGAVLMSGTLFYV